MAIAFDIVGIVGVVAGVICALYIVLRVAAYKWDIPHIRKYFFPAAPVVPPHPLTEGQPAFALLQQIAAQGATQQPVPQANQVANNST